MTMVTRDIGIVGVGLWDAEPVTNEHFGARETNAPVRDPYKGRKADDGSIQIAGLTLTPASHPRTIAAVAHAFADPHRGTRKRRFFPRDLKVSEAETEAARRAIPKNAAIICHNLGINQALAFEVDSICNSSISQLITGSSLILSGFAKHVLCVQSVAYSRVTDPTSSSSVQEADMASAFVIGPHREHAWHSDGAPTEVCTRRSSCIGHRRAGPSRDAGGRARRRASTSTSIPSCRQRSWPRSRRTQGSFAAKHWGARK